MEGKKKYFVLVLFLLLALMIFAFANPIVEDDKEFQDNSKDKTEQVEKPDVIVDTEKDNNNNVPVVRPTQPVQNNQTTEDKEDEIDTTYEDALEAVKYAEATYKAEDVEKAKELVNKVTDTTKKGELEDRLAEVEAGIEVMELIKELEYQVGKATEREDIVSAKDYRDEKEVAKKLEALTNEEVKKALQERLDKVSQILDDETAPVVNIKNNEAFKEDVTITVEDDNEFYMYLSKDGKDAEKVENNHKTTGEGIYTLTVVDKALNETTIRFVVDGTAPVFKGLENTKHYDEFTVEVEDISEVTIMISKDGEEEKEIANNTKVTEEGTYKITATDEAGNTTTYWVAIDNTAPTIERTSSDRYPTTKQEVKVFDRYLTTVEVTINGKSTIYERKDFTVGEQNENFAIELEFSSDGDYKIVATDRRGLTTTDEFTIDSIFPFIGNVKDGEYYNTDVEPEIVEKNIETIKLNNQDYNGEKISEEGTYTLVVTDKAGHSVSKTFTIDKTAPTIKNVEEGKYYKNVTPIVEDENLDTVKLYRIVGKTKLQVLTYKNGDAITTDGKYEIVATDKAGNKTIVTNFTVDATAPEIVLIDKIEAIQGDLIPIKPIIRESNMESVVLEKQNLLGKYEKVENYTFEQKNGYVQGSQIKDHGKYRLTATDKAGNQTISEFEIDNKAPVILGKVNGNSIATPLITGVYQSIEIVVADDHFDTSKIIVLKQRTTQIGNIEIPLYTRYNYTYGDVIDEEGTYLIGAADQAFNISTTKIIIDRTAPEINVEDGKHYQSLDIVVTEKNPIELNNGVTLSKYQKIINKYVPVINYKYGETITEEGKYKVTVTDIAGNSITRYFVIDNTAPTTNIIEGAIYNSITPEINDENLDIVTLNDEPYTVGTPITEENTYTLVIKDKAGNTTARTFKIDADAIEISGIANGASYNRSVTPKVVIHNIGINATATISKNGAPASAYTTTTIDATTENEGTYTITVTDDYNNKQEVTFSIDITKPEIKETTRTTEQGANVNTNTKLTVEVNVEDNIDADKTIKPVVTHSVQGNLGELSEIEISKDYIGTYTLTYDTTDKAGNAADPVVVTVEVYKADYYLEFEDVSTYTYNGTKQYPKAVIKDENGIVTGEVSYVIEDNKNATDAGTYKVTASTDTYTRVSSISKEFTIEQREVKVVFTHHNGLNTTYEYDGNNNPYTAKLVDNATNEYIQDLTIVYTNSRGNIATTLNAGTYTMTVVNPSELNYKVMNNLQETITIEKAKISVTFPTTLTKGMTKDQVIEQMTVVNGNGVNVKSFVEIELYEIKKVFIIGDIPTKVDGVTNSGRYSILVKEQTTIISQDNYDINGSSITGLMSSEYNV